MQTRRSFLLTVLSTLAAQGAPSAFAGQRQEAVTGSEVFKRILSHADKGNWRALPIGNVMEKIAFEFQGTQYEGGTLETSPNHEACTVTLKAFDCVTFFETTLAFARMLKKGGRTTQYLLNEVKFMRYRGGTLGDFATRLHYMSDWFADNERKNVIKILAQLPGAEAFTKKINFMSSHPASYRQLAAHPGLIAKIKQTEDAINSRSMKFIPINKIAAIESLLQTGDIVGVCTDIPGLDILHTGLVIRTADGIAHFMDASTKTTQVTLEPGHIGASLNWSKHITGAMFARPLEPSA